MKHIILNNVGSSVMLFSPQDERKLHMLENSLNFRFKRIGTPGAKEIAEASADVATRKLESVSPYLARQFVPYARTFIEGFVRQNSGEDRDSDFDEDESEEVCKYIFFCLCVYIYVYTYVYIYI
jgi:hypothetical protein